MNNVYFSVRHLAMISLLLFGFTTVSQAAALPPGKVTNVNPSARTFTVQWAVHAVSKHGMASAYTGSSRERTFKTSDKTTYWMGSNKGSWENVTKGSMVNVTAHAQGSERVADKVQIVSGS
jgi:hypothetical protein